MTEVIAADSGSLIDLIYSIIGEDITVKLIALKLLKHQNEV